MTTYRLGPPTTLLVHYGCEPPPPRIERYLGADGKYYVRIAKWGAHAR